MLRAIFARRDGGTYILGPFPELRFEKNVLRASPVGPALAEHRDHSWRVAGARYLRLDCEAKLVLRFEHLNGSPSALFGPFEQLCAVDGVLYADREIFATYHEGTGVWVQDPGGAGWPIVVAVAR
jgi:hypothetical protein